MKVETTATTMKPYLQYRIGRMFYDGYRTKTDMETALKWLEQAASGSMDAAKAEAQSRHYQTETILNQLIKQATGEQKSYFESILGAAYYYSDTLRDAAKAKELLERAAQNGSKYAAVLLNRIAEHERNAVDSLLCSLMALLNSAEHYSNVDLQNASTLLFGRGDLSKEMIAELIYKRQDKENTSQR